MVKIELLDLEAGPDYILFNPDEEGDNEHEKYPSVLEKMAASSTGKPKCSEASAKDIRVSLSGDGFYVVHVLGVFRDYPLNLKLLFAKESNYLLGVGRNGLWKVVHMSPITIEGADTFEFCGSYMDSRYSVETMPVGYCTLCYALVELNEGGERADAFMKVALNLCEAMRYPGIESLVLKNWDNPGLLTPTFAFYVHNWGGSISVTVRCFKATNEWRRFKNWIVVDKSGRVDDIDLWNLVDQNNVATILRVCKGKPDDGEKEKWVEEEEKKQRRAKDDDEEKEKWVEEEEKKQRRAKEEKRL